MSRDSNTINDAKNTGNTEARSRNARRNDTRFDLRERLKTSLAESVKGIPAKRLEQETGIPFRTIEGHRTGLQLCSVEQAFRYIEPCRIRRSRVKPSRR